MWQDTGGEYCQGSPPFFIGFCYSYHLLVCRHVCSPTRPFCEWISCTSPLAFYLGCAFSWHWSVCSGGFLGTFTYGVCKLCSMTWFIQSCILVPRLGAFVHHHVNSYLI